jgi:hypothetical protein
MAIIIGGAAKTVTSTNELALNTILTGSYDAGFNVAAAYTFSVTALGVQYQVGLENKNGYEQVAVVNATTDEVVAERLVAGDFLPVLSVGDYKIVVYNLAGNEASTFKLALLDHTALPATEMPLVLLVNQRNASISVDKLSTGTEVNQTMVAGSVNVYKYITTAPSSILNVSLANENGGLHDIFIFNGAGALVEKAYYADVSALVDAGSYYIVIDGSDGVASATYDLSISATAFDVATAPVVAVDNNTIYADVATTGTLLRFTSSVQGVYLEQFASADVGKTNGLIQLFDSNKNPISATEKQASGYVWSFYPNAPQGVYYALIASKVDFHIMVTDNSFDWSPEANAITYDLTIPRKPFPSSTTSTPARSNVKFSQKSIKGLPEALAALASAVTTQGSAGTQALTNAIAQEVADRNAAINGAIAQEVTDRNSAISTAVQGVLGTAPEAFDTLKEIADYIAVNPSATVADAINSAIASAKLAVTNLTTAVDAEKAYSDWKSAQALRLKGDVITLTGTLTDSKAVVTTTRAVEMVLNYGYARLTNIVTAETYDLPVTVAAGVASVDFAGYEAEATDLTQFTGVIQYAYKVDATTERAAFAAV